MHIIDNQTYTLEDIRTLMRRQEPVSLGPRAEEAIRRSCRFLQEVLEKRQQVIYGINTGFGSLHRMRVPEKDMQTLQENLVRSHACGAGDELPPPAVRLMLLLKIITLARGYSGVQLKTVRRLADFYNHDVLPVGYEKGSLGASGDLAPLAHLSLPLIGEGEVRYRGRKRPAREVLAELGWEPIRLQAKEGLALLNGTQFMTAVGILNLWEAQKLDLWADLVAAASLEAYDGRIEPFSPVIQRIRPHRGQEETARRIRRILRDSAIIHREKPHVQDPYSFRCVPQVHGSVKHVLKSVIETFEVEINAVTDNPIIDAENGQILSGGNFHGEPLAIASDMLAIALADLSNISERRTYRLISGKRGLPVYLIENPGLNSGLMIPQYMAASLVNQNKQLSHPNSVDSIESSNGQEDHVSMGANAVLKTSRIIENVKTVLAVELLTANQALHFRDLPPSPVIQKFLEPFRRKVPYIAKDEILYDKIRTIIDIYEELPVEFFRELAGGEVSEIR
ncbi:MAG: histidine ammonia-lyase [Chlorobi bacterium]|nr:histidine ammonia-lyase [Chlorobiota bacterium]